MTGCDHSRLALSTRPCERWWPRWAAVAIRALGYKQRESLQSFGVTDISCPILDPKGNAMAVLTSPYIRRVDQHVGPTLDEARALLIRTAQAPSVNQQAEERDQA